MRRWITLSAILGNVLSVTAYGAPLPQSLIEQLASDYLAVRSADVPFPPLTIDEALRAQRAFVKRIEPKLGRPVGYKVGLVTREMQERFKTTAPVRGVLLSGMLLRDGAEIATGYGVRPVCEADLIVVVKDKRINRARTPLEAARSLKEIAAFIELPDAFLATNQPIDSAMLTAVNVGARFGVIGERVPLKGNENLVTALEYMTVRMTDQNGRELARAHGRTILDQPLNAVLWLAEELGRVGEQLQPGDLISLGALANITPSAGQVVNVEYHGLPIGTIRASVKFR